MDAGAMGALPTRDELFDVVLKGKQLEQTMKDRQAGGGAKSGRYKKHDTARPVSASRRLPAAQDGHPAVGDGQQDALRHAGRVPRRRGVARARANIIRRGAARRGAAARPRPRPPVPVPAPAPAAPRRPAADASPPARDACFRRATPRRRWRPGFAPPAPSAAVADDDSDDEFLAFNSGMGVRTSPQADRLDEFMAADAGYVPPPRAPLAAVRAEPTPDLRGPEFQARVRREADAAAARPEARAMLVEDEDLILAQLEASDDVEDHFARAERGARAARYATTADDERDALGLAAETLESLAALV
ncbi:hypothetical protein JL722_2973 [Aureococcus anophagefferens]|nr:hypothetical protein JL722_2973 [Aureococcus anophagefferens]